MIVNFVTVNRGDFFELSEVTADVLDRYLNKRQGDRSDESSRAVEPAEVIGADG